MLKPQRLRAVLVVLVVASSTAMAEKLKPPTVMLGEPTTTIVVADYKEAGPADRIVFSKVAVLQSQGDVPDLIDLGKPDLREPLVAGARYIIAYSPYAEDRFERIVVNSRGAQFISSPGVEPGLWEDSSDKRALVAWRIDGEVPRKALPRLLRMLSSDDSQLREFAAAEIALRPSLIASLDGPQQKALQRFVASDVGPDRARTSLLQVAPAMPAESEAIQGWDAVAVDLLKKTPVETLQFDRRSSLILAALAYAPTGQQHSDGKLQERWLRSNDMALVEASAQALQDISVDLAKAKIEAALAVSTLPADNRSVLDGVRLRLDLVKEVPANNAR